MSSPGANLFLRLSSSFACILLKLVRAYREEEGNSLRTHCGGGREEGDRELAETVSRETVNRWRRRRKKDTIFAHMVGGVHSEGARISFLLKYKQKTKKDEPKKTKKDEGLSSSFRVRLSSLFAYT